MKIIPCPVDSAHDATCICGGTGKISVAPARGGTVCQTCGDPEKGFAAMGNVTITDSGVYVPAACEACGTYGASSLVEKLNKDRCPCHGLGNVEVIKGVVTPHTCERCGAVPTQETLARVRALVA